MLTALLVCLMLGSGGVSSCQSSCWFLCCILLAAAEQVKRVGKRCCGTGNGLTVPQHSLTACVVPCRIPKGLSEQVFAKSGQKSEESKEEVRDGGNARSKQRSCF